MPSEKTPLAVVPAPAYGASPKVVSPVSERVSEALEAETRRRQRELRALSAALVFCVFFMFVEVVGGYVAHSLAILTDAAHLLTDVGAYAMSIFALKASSRSSCDKFSFGWHRAEVVGTLASVFTIWALVGAIALEAVNRMITMYHCATELRHARYQCEAVDSRLLIIVGSLGLVVNFVCAAILKIGGTHGHSHYGLSHGDHGHSHDDHDDHALKDHDDHGHSHDDHGHSHDDHGHSHEDHGHSHDDHGHSHDSHDDHGHGSGGGCGGAQKSGFALNAAFAHAVSDSIQSVGVILAGVFMYVMIHRTEGTYMSRYSWYNLADPASSILFAVLALRATKELIRDLLNILMEATPPNVDPENIRTALQAIDGVTGVHDLHVWSIAAGKVSLSVHIEASSGAVLPVAQKLLERRFGLTHHTIQVDPTEVGSSNCASDICRH